VTALNPCPKASCIRGRQGISLLFFDLQWQSHDVHVGDTVGLKVGSGDGS
jgi:hypothetical protein